MKILKEEINKSIITVELETTVSLNDNREDSKDFAKYLNKLKISYKDSKKIVRGMCFGLYTGSVKNIIKLIRDFWDYDNDEIIEIFENSWQLTNINVLFIYEKEGVNEHFR